MPGEVLETILPQVCELILQTLEFFHVVPLFFGVESHLLPLNIDHPVDVMVEPGLLGPVFSLLIPPKTEESRDDN